MKLNSSVAISATFASLITGTALTLSNAPAQAASLFGNNGISFDTTTSLNFYFEGAKGAFRSDLFVVEVLNDGTLKKLNPILFSEKKPGFDLPKNGDFQSTCPVTVEPCATTFTFEAGKLYSLALASELRTIADDENSYEDRGTVYSTDSLNPSGQQAKFDGSLINSSLNLKFDDRGNGNDKDFNDFRVRVAAVPEPATLAGLALVGGALVVSRRRKTA